MQKLLAALIAPFAAVGLMASAGAASAQSRIKDIASIEGVRANQLVGYGLVVGLAGTGGVNLRYDRSGFSAHLQAPLRALAQA